MFSTILFDLDGTLMNTAEGITEAVRYALETLQFPPLPYAVRERFVGPPLRESFMRYCGVDEKTAEELLSKYREYYRETGMHQCRPYDGIPELLENLQARGKELLVATAKPTVFSKQILEEWKLDGYFKEIVGASFDKKLDSKDKIIALARKMASHEEIVMVGDTVYDIEGARKNGLPTIAVMYGFGNREDLYAAKPAFTCETVEEIGDLV